MKEYLDYIVSRSEGELSDDDVEAAAGGKKPLSTQGRYYTPPYVSK